MSHNPILEEVWQVKDTLAHEADYDVHQFFENLRRWSKKHPHSGIIVGSAEELRDIETESSPKVESAGIVHPK